MVIESAQDRIFRILVLSIGIGQLAFTLLAVPAIIAQWQYLHPLYSIAVVAVFCALPPVLGIFAFRAPVRVLRALGVLHALSGVIFIVFWPMAMVVARIPDDPIPWLLNMITAAVCFAALALRPSLAWGYLALTAACSGTMRYIVYGGGDISIALQDAIMTCIITGVLMSLMLLALRAGREQDAASREAQEVAAASAVAETIEAQRSRFHAFMHDDVLATLNAAARNLPGSQELTRTSAQNALAKMDEFRDGTTGPELLTAAEFEKKLRDAAAQYGIGLTVSTPRIDDAVRYPSDITDALAEALTEAIRNSIRHGEWPDGRPVRRSAFARFDSRGVEILVNDDGKGFVAHRIGLDRLGIRVSILSRVNSQPGGRATVTSSRGAGTTVSLTWNAPRGGDK
jgi:signal transduction histidine kinase